MSLTILQDGEKPLRQKAKRVDKINDVIRNIVASMTNTMLENNGVGLSGNQVGILKQIIIVMINGIPVPMINPEIIKLSEEKKVGEEGCLSFVGQYYPIQRHKQITVKYRDIKGHPRVETYEGLESVIIQHEVDHLHGITFKDRMDT
jgi:peptide deformylase